MKYEDIKEGQVLSAKKYNELSLAKWHKDYEKASAEAHKMNYWGNMPQLAFYGFYSPRTGEFRKTGFVRKLKNGSHWFKTKKEALEYKERVYL